MKNEGKNRTSLFIDKKTGPVHFLNRTPFEKSSFSYRPLDLRCNAHCVSCLFILFYFFFYFLCPVRASLFLWCSFALYTFGSRSSGRDMFPLDQIWAFWSIRRLRSDLDLSPTLLCSFLYIFADFTHVLLSAPPFHLRFFL